MTSSVGHAPMRAAIFADVHGNSLALEAVLSAAIEAEVDEFWVLGDLVAHGPHPDAALRRIRGLPGTRVVMGNTDRYVLTGELPPMVPAPADVRTAADVSLIADASASFAWTRGAITSDGGCEWLAARPPEIRMTLPDGTRVLLVHVAPGRDDGPGLEDSLGDDDLRREVGDVDADLVVVGHTHTPMDRAVDGVRVVNVGSVSLPATAERRAMWTLLAADADGFALQPRFAAYDVDAVIASLFTRRHPSADWLAEKLRRSLRYSPS